MKLSLASHRIAMDCSQSNGACSPNNSSWPQSSSAFEHGTSTRANGVAPHSGDGARDGRDRRRLDREEATSICFGAIHMVFRSTTAPRRRPRWCRSHTSRRAGGARIGASSGWGAVRPCLRVAWLIRPFQGVGTSTLQRLVPALRQDQGPGPRLERSPGAEASPATLATELHVVPKVFRQPDRRTPTSLASKPHHRPRKAKRWAQVKAVRLGWRAAVEEALKLQRWLPADASPAARARRRIEEVAAA